jgi:hypothetical protein
MTIHLWHFMASATVDPILENGFAICDPIPLELRGKPGYGFP